MAAAKVSKMRLRLQRRATAYARLAAKAHRAGEYKRAEQYAATEARLRRQAERS